MAVALEARTGAMKARAAKAIILHIVLIFSLIYERDLQTCREKENGSNSKANKGCPVRSVTFTLSTVLRQRSITR